MKQRIASIACRSFAAVMFMVAGHGLAQHEQHVVAIIGAIALGILGLIDAERIRTRRNP